MKYMALLLLCLFPALLPAQQPGWEQAFREWVTLEDAESDYGEDTFELLADMADSPLNLNLATREQLEQLPFLSAQQVEAVMAYVYRYGPVRSLAELQMVTELDADTRRLLQHFVFVGPQQPRPEGLRLSDVARYGRQQLMATLRLPLYDRRGDFAAPNCYVGYKYRHDLRYQFTYGDRLKFGLTAAQDAGEPFFANRNTLGYDHYAYYFQLRNLGRLEALNLGMYRVQFGLGLLMNTGFHLGKLATLQSLGRSTRALAAHSSRSSAGYLQGAAATLRLAPHWRATAFLSYRPLDATLNADGSARTLLTTGYHRTPAELEKKHNTHALDLGFSLGYKGQVNEGMAFVNLNAVYTRLDRPLHPQLTALYRRYAPYGNDFLNASLDYGYTHHRFSLSGETALNRRGAMAALHTLSLRLSDELSLLLLHRYYDRRYTALHARSFSEGSGVQNEHGLYLGATWRPSARLLLQAYVDYTHFPWARYLVSTSSDAFDTQLRARILLKRCTLDGSYRLHIRQRDNADHSLLQNRTEHRARLRVAYPLPASLSAQTQADAVALRVGRDVSRGGMLSQQLEWQHRWLRLQASAAWFHTDDYDSRLYQYERSVLYDFSFPMYYGHGLRYALMARADLGRRLMLATKIGTTDYFDRAVISSGLQQIDASSQTDVLLQLRYKF